MGVDGTPILIANMQAAEKVLDPSLLDLVSRILPLHNLCWA